MIHPPMLQNITVLYHTVILNLSIDIVKNTHAVLLDFFSHLTTYNVSIFFYKHLPKYHPRDILIIERNTLRYKRKKPDSTKYIR